MDASFPIDKIDEIVGTAGKLVVENSIEAITKRVSKIEQNLNNAFKINNREMSISCPESIQRYSLSITTKRNSFFKSKANFELGKVRRASIRSVVGLESPPAVSILENGFELNLKKLKPEEQYILDIEYFIEDPEFLESLVDRRVVHETPYENDTEYWMVAQLKHLDALKSKYGRIDLRDVGFNVNVGVHQDINTKVPEEFKDVLVAVAELLQRKGRDEKYKSYVKLRSLQNKPQAGHEFEILGRLEELFSPLTFKRFVQVSRDFHYSSCEKGVNVYDSSFMAWPKFMKVTSRTDLGLHKPASEGTLVYKKSDFISEIEQLFPK